jgi:hypothetical protein
LPPTPFRGSLNLVFDALAFVECAETSAFHCRYVDENVPATALRLNEPITLGRIKPLDCPCGNRMFLKVFVIQQRVQNVPPVEYDIPWQGQSKSRNFPV